MGVDPYELKFREKLIVGSIKAMGIVGATPMDIHLILQTEKMRDTSF